MTARLWRLCLLALAALLGAVFYLGRWTATTPPQADSYQQQETQWLALRQAGDQLSARIYRAHQRQTAQATAIGHVRWAIPDVESYNADNVHGNVYDPDAVPTLAPGPDPGTTDSGYTGMTVLLLTRIYDSGFAQQTWVNPRDPGYPTGVARVIPTATHYCVIAHSGNWYAWKLGPDGSILASLSAAAVCQRRRLSR